MPTTFKQTPADPKRFDVSKTTLRVDNFMTQFIKVGGIGIILTVFGIFLFIVIKVIPLFQQAEVEKVQVLDTGVTDYAVIGIDEWSELPFLATLQGEFHFFNTTGERQSFTKKLPLNEAVTFTAARYHQKDETIIFGTDDGRFVMADIDYEAFFDEKGERSIKVAVNAHEPIALDAEGRAIQKLDYFDADKKRLIAAIVGNPDQSSVVAVSFRRKKSLFGGAGKWELSGSHDLTPDIQGQPTEILINGLGNAAIVSTAAGEVFYFRKTGRALNLEQRFRPFNGKPIATMDWLFGNDSLAFTSNDGDNVIYSLSLDPADEAAGRQYQQTKTLDQLPGPGTLYSKSLRNRSYLIASGSTLSIRYSTTATTRWEEELPFEPKSAILGSKYKTFFLVDAAGQLHHYALNDPHPESGMRAFFAKIWYEGQNEPRYMWQSTGGEADFEPKLSMMPLIFGSLKGTFYAMLFALPIAVLASLYTSQFLRPEYKKVVKPMMEIMASLPSVVLGFLGALWLAPLVVNRVPSLLMIFLLVPSAAIAVGFIWARLPQGIRVLLKPGQEFLLFFPILILVAWVGWILGPLVENMLFVVTDPTTGERIADFRMWWPQTTGLSFQQRNSLIVGIMMGFAVIPIIFTISEDAMSNVPQYLTSASLALGASRWQTAWRIVLPTASPGVFSALMIGLGRAVGETMIVVMATGNTAIIDWNIFNGMRTLSANIAVELPEAPENSTLYRSLFFGALLLFIITFMVNTIAEITRSRLREKYKTVG